MEKIKPSDNRKYNRKPVRWIVISVTALALLLIYKLFDPADGGYFPACPFHSLTGWLCPGCGSQRAIHGLLNFEFKNAFAANALLVTAIPYIVLAAVFDWVTITDKSLLKLKKILYGKVALLIVFVITLCFFIFRNL